MALVMEKPMAVFNLEQIVRGDLIWGLHSSWKEGKAGFVTSATEEQLIIQYYPGMGNVTNHFRILINEVRDGQWDIRWSADLKSIQEYNAKEDCKQQGTGGDEADDSGRINL